MTAGEQPPDPGLAALLSKFSDLVGGDAVYLWFTPPPAGAEIRWRVWAGVPTGSGGGEWGRGVTPYAAVQSAFENAVRSMFDGRIGMPKPSAATGAGRALAEAAYALCDLVTPDGGTGPTSSVIDARARLVEALAGFGQVGS